MNAEAILQDMQSIRKVLVAKGYAEAAVNLQVVTPKPYLGAFNVVLSLGPDRRKHHFGHTYVEALGKARECALDLPSGPERKAAEIKSLRDRLAELEASI